MPVYEYRCRRCDAVTATRVRLLEAPRQVRCAQCQGEAGRIVSMPSVHLARGAKVRRLDPKYDKMVDAAMRNTPGADPARLLNRRGDIAKGRPER